MPHIFPTRRLQDGEVADPEVLNELFQPITAKLAGHLNEQDINATAKLFSYSLVTAEAYYDVKHFVRASDPQWGVSDAYATRIALGDREAIITGGSTAWTSIADNDAGAAAMTVELVTGEDTLLCIAQIQYASWLGGGLAPPSVNRPFRLQFALSLDGVVQDDTITGAHVWPDPPPQQWYRATATNPAGAAYDYRHIQYIQNTIGLSAAVHPVRITKVVPVNEGTHTVSVMARRLPAVDYKPEEAGAGVDIEVFNRRLFVLRIKGLSKGDGSAASLTVSAFNDGDVLNVANLRTGAFDVLRTVINDLGPEHIERGAFRHEHLPSLVYGPAAAAISPAAAVTVATTGANNYPGYGTNAVNWVVVNDGAGNNLSITGPSTGLWALDTNPGTLVVIANVAVSRVTYNAVAASTVITPMGMLALAFTNSVGTRTVVGSTEVYVNGHNPLPGAVAGLNQPLGDDAPLMWVVHSSELSAANKLIAQIDVVATAHDADASGAVQLTNLETQHGVVWAFVIRDVTP